MSTLNEQLINQLDWHWSHQVKQRLEGLTDAEYFFEPVPDCWSLRPDGESTAPIQGGSGAMRIEFAFPEPEPAPFTTIAWRLGHLIVGVFAVRNAAHFGREGADYFTYDYAATADGAMAQLCEEYEFWRAGVAGLSDEQLWEPVGQAEGDHADSPMIELILHINREAIHHLAEIALLRDLYAHRS
jgi:hypothetical protein